MLLSSNSNQHPKHLPPQCEKFPLGLPDQTPLLPAVSHRTLPGRRIQEQVSVRLIIPTGNQVMRPAPIPPSFPPEWLPDNNSHQPVLPQAPMQDFWFLKRFPASRNPLRSQEMGNPPWKCSPSGDSTHNRTRNRTCRQVDLVQPLRNFRTLKAVLPEIGISQDRSHRGPTVIGAALILMVTLQEPFQEDHGFLF